VNVTAPGSSPRQRNEHIRWCIYRSLNDCFDLLAYRQLDDRTRFESGERIGIGRVVTDSPLPHHQDTRVRSPWFGGFSYNSATMGRKPERSKVGVGQGVLRAGEFASRQGPWGLPAVCAARSLLTPCLRSSRNRVRPRFHCPYHRPESAALPRFKALPHRGRLTVAKVSQPSSQLGRELLDHLR
jgi:hypothetical protein